MSRFDDMLFDAQIRDDIERNVLGVIEPDQPTPTSDFLWRERFDREGRREFTAAERRYIRRALGMEPFAASQHTEATQQETRG